jgi:hypothetical protein
MPRIKVRQLHDTTATAGVHFGHGAPARRKLEPGEVLDLPEGELFEVIWKTGCVELTRDPITRPLEYANGREARLCSPSFTPRGPDEEIERDAALDKVSAQLAQLEVAPDADTADESPVTETLQPIPAPGTPAPGNRRAARRAANREQIST